MKFIAALFSALFAILVPVGLASAHNCSVSNPSDCQTVPVNTSRAAGLAAAGAAAAAAAAAASGSSSGAPLDGGGVADDLGIDRPDGDPADSDDTHPTSSEVAEDLADWMSGDE